MNWYSDERVRSVRMLTRLMTARGSRSALHLCNLVASVHFSGLPTITLTEMRARLGRGTPGAAPGNVVLHGELHGFGAGSIGEMAGLSSLVAAYQPRNLLEFGTCQGCSTWHLWANSPKDARITTVDLPSGLTVEGSTDPELQGDKVRRFLPEDPRVRLVETDSRSFDPSGLGSVDFCFIDAGHSYACVKNDTEKALSVLVRGGLLVWHDATWTDDDYGVNRYLKELRGQGLDIRQVTLGPFDYCALAVLIRA